MDLVYIIRHPEKHAANTECDAFVAHHDIPVTLMNLAGIEPPSDLDGKNIWKWVTGESPQMRAHATCIFYPWLWIQNKKYAYMTDLDGTEERLYDRENDPKQSNNIASEYKEVCEELKGVLWAAKFMRVTGMSWWATNASHSVLAACFSGCLMM